MTVSVVVSRPCGISTERGQAGAELDASCPAYADQRLVRELVVGGGAPTDGSSRVQERLVLVVNF